MTELSPMPINDGSRLPDEGTLRRVHFVERAESDQIVLMRFVDPAPRIAMVVADTSPSDPHALEILTVAVSPKDNPHLREKLSHWVVESVAAGEPPPVITTIHGAQIVWHHRRASILAAADRIDPLLLAVVEFSHFERELRKLEEEIAAAWPELSSDTPLAHDVTPADLDRHELLGQRMGRTLQRRMRHSRIEPHLYRASAPLPSQGMELGERLRDKTHVEDRLEALDGHLEVFEYTYELSSQRMSEFRAARKERTLEWVIILLLATETIFLLIDLLWTLEK